MPTVEYLMHGVDFNENIGVILNRVGPQLIVPRKTIGRLSRIHGAWGVTDLSLVNQFAVLLILPQGTNVAAVNDPIDQLASLIQLAVFVDYVVVGESPTGPEFTEVTSHSFDHVWERRGEREMEARGVQIRNDGGPHSNQGMGWAAYIASDNSSLVGVGGFIIEHEMEWIPDKTPGPNQLSINELDDEHDAGGDSAGD